MSTAPQRQVEEHQYGTTEMSPSPGCPMAATTASRGVTVYRSMGHLGCRGIAFWDGTRRVAGFVAERPKPVKGRNKDGEKEGKKIKGAAQYTCLAMPCRYLITMVHPVSSLTLLLGEGVSVHGDVSLSQGPACVECLWLERPEHVLCGSVYQCVITSKHGARPASQQEEWLGSQVPKQPLTLAWILERP